MSFLPDNYVKPESPSNYYKFVTGDNKFRILSPAITGFFDWSADKKPIRTKSMPKTLVDPTKPAKHFWAFVIWDYKESKVKILEITQATIQNAIFDLHSDDNWGNPTEYDLNVKKTGEKMETKYSVVPTPPKPLSVEIKTAYSKTNIDLNQLYINGDPFNPKAVNEKIAEEYDEELPQIGHSEDDFQLPKELL